MGVDIQTAFERVFDDAYSWYDVMDEVADANETNAIMKQYDEMFSKGGSFVAGVNYYGDYAIILTIENGDIPSLIKQIRAALGRDADSVMIERLPKNRILLLATDQYYKFA